MMRLTNPNMEELRRLSSYISLFFGINPNLYGVLKKHTGSVWCMRLFDRICMAQPSIYRICMVHDFYRPDLYGAWEKPTGSVRRRLPATVSVWCMSSIDRICVAHTMPTRRHPDQSGAQCSIDRICLVQPGPCYYLLLYCNTTIVPKYSCVVES